MPDWTGTGRVQRRAAAYVLRTLLGPLAPALDDAQIDAAVLAGRLDVRRVELDPAAIAERFPLVPLLTPTRATLAALQLQLPPLAQLWSADAPVRIVLEQLELHATLAHAPEAAPPADLAASLHAAATDAVREAAAAAAAEEAAAGAPPGFAARWAQSLLARIQVELDAATVRLSPPPTSAAHTPTLVLRLGPVRIGPDRHASTPFAYEFSLDSLHLTLDPPEPLSDSDSDSDMGSDSDAAQAEANYLAMSSAVLDLRASVYHDATPTAAATPPKTLLSLTADTAGKVGVVSACSGTLSPTGGCLRLAVLALHLDPDVFTHTLAPWLQAIAPLRHASQPASSPSPSSVPPPSPPSAWAVTLQHVHVSYTPPAQDALQLDLHQLAAELASSLRLSLSTLVLRTESTRILSLGEVDTTPAVQAVQASQTAETGWVVDLAPVTGTVPLLYVGQVATSIQSAIASILSSPASSPSASPPPPSSEHDPRPQVRLSCPGINLALPIPRHTHTPLPPVPSSRAGSYRLALRSVQLATHPDQPARERKTHFAPRPPPAQWTLGIHHVVLYHTPPGGHEEGIVRLPEPALTLAAHQGGMDVRLTDVEVRLDPDRWAQLEMALDDLTCWAAALAPPTPSLGGPGESAGPSESAESSESTEPSEPSVRDVAATTVEVARVRMELHFPLLAAGASVVALVSGVEVRLGQGVVAACLAQAGVTFFPEHGAPHTLLAASPSNAHCGRIHIRTSATRHSKTTRLTVEVRDALAHLVLDAPYLAPLAQLAHTPDDTFVHVTPADRTELALRLVNLQIGVTPGAGQPVLACLLPTVQATASLTPSGVQAAETSVSTRLLVLDKGEADLLPALLAHTGTPLSQWTQLGFAHLAHASLRGTFSPAHVTLSRARVRLTLAADTLAVLTQFASALSPTSTSDESGSSEPSSPRTLRGQSVSPTPREDEEEEDDDFFAPHIPAPTPGPPVAEDEEISSAPPLAQSIFLDLQEAVDGTPSLPRPVRVRTPRDATAEKAHLGSGGHTRAAPPAAKATSPRATNYTLAPTRESYRTGSTAVRVFRPSWPGPRKAYYSHLLARAAKEDAQECSLRVDAGDVNVTIELFGGYDWVSSREYVRSKASRVRRRLLKIKQLLAQGYAPAEAVPDAAEDLMRSVHLPLPADLSGMQADGFLHIVHENVGWEEEEGAAAGKRVPTPRPKSKLARASQPALRISLRGARGTYRAYHHPHPDTGRGSRAEIHLAHVEIVDEIPTSTWRTFMTAMAPDDPRVRTEADKAQVVLRVDGFPPPQGGEGDEFEVTAQVAPVRLHVDQDALDFLKVFFGFSAQRDQDEGRAAAPPSGGPFIRQAEVWPIPIKLDYKPKRVNFGLLKQGQVVEMMNFFHFDGARLTLRHTTLHGIQGVPRLLDSLHDIWAPDVTANQLTDVLSGIAPLRTVSTLGGGLAELALLPIEQYHKDGRPLKGFQLAARRLAHTAALEAVRLSARLATGTQTLLEGAEDVLVGPAVVAPVSGTGSHYAAPPSDMREAMDQAYRGLSRGFTSAAQIMLALPMDLYERRYVDDASTHGPSDEAGGAKAIPLAFLRSAAGASEALSRALLGLQGTLQPTLVRDTRLKYKLDERAEEEEDEKDDEWE